MREGSSFYLPSRAPLGFCTACIERPSFPTTNVLPLQLSRRSSCSRGDVLLVETLAGCFADRRVVEATVTITKQDVFGGQAVPCVWDDPVATSLRSASLLRLAPLADAAARGVTGLLMAAGAGALIDLLGLPGPGRTVPYAPPGSRSTSSSEGMHFKKVFDLCERGARGLLASLCPGHPEPGRP